MKPTSPLRATAADGAFVGPADAASGAKEAVKVGAKEAVRGGAAVGVEVVMPGEAGLLGASE